MTKAQNSAHIVIIDDDKRIRDLLADYLNNLGFQTSTAKDQSELEAILQQKTPQLAILDVMLQDLSGLDLLESHLIPKAIPTIVLSALGESKDRIKGLEQGAADYLAKPFEPRELVLRINNILRTHLPN